MRDADSEDEGHRYRGRSVKRSGSSVASSVRGKSPERDPRIAAESDDEREGMSASESGNEYG